MDKAALLIIDAQPEYFAPIGKVVRPRGVERVIGSGFMAQMCCDTTTREAAHHRTHLASLNGFLAEVKRSDEIIAP